MKRTLAMSCLAWHLAACAPDLDANGAAGCDERTPCDHGASCYRGLCVPDEIDASASESDEAERGQSHFDATSGSMGADSAVASQPDDAGQVADAGEEEDVGGEGSAQDAGAPRAIAPDRDAAPTPAADASASGSAPAARPAPDAGRPASSPCTLTLCCDEARKAYEANQKLDGRWDAKKGKCGCGDPDLFRLLSCGSSQRTTP